MERDETTSLPTNLRPLSPDTRRLNEFRICEIFPFRTWNSLPSLHSVLQNIALSAGTLVAAGASLAATAVIFLPIGIVKSVVTGFGTISGSVSKGAESVAGPDKRRRCIIVNGASSGIGAALAIEYAGPDTHIVLIARDVDRLRHVADRAQAKGATTTVRSIDYLQPSSITELHRLLHETNDKEHGIDVAISCAGLTGYRGDVLGPGNGPIRGGPDCELSPERTDHLDTRVWGTAAASRILRVNVEACQEFILGSWELMRDRRQRGDGPASPKIVIFASSVAFYSPANFTLYASSKAYLYSLGQSLHVASARYGIGVTTVCPGFIESGMTVTMIEDGATLPKWMLGDPRKLAKVVRLGEEAGERVVMYPFSQVWTVFAAKALNPLLEVFGMWAGTATGVAAWLFS